MDVVYSTRSIGAGKTISAQGAGPAPFFTPEVSMHRSLSLALSALAYLMVACDRRSEVTSPALAHGEHALSQNVAVSGEVEREVARLRQLTAPFHQFETAAAAGWGTQITGCFSDATLGGMGYHYGNVALIDGTVDVLAPELLLYEPQKNGRLRLVAVEYVVPFSAWTAPEPPRLFDQSFHRNEAFGLWVLHVWHYRHNPSGMFTDWNPDVSCKFAAP